MKALFKQSTDPYDMVLKEIPKPEPGPNEVVIKVHAAGICGTDIKIYQNHYHMYKPPVVIGHEFSGRIVEIGSEDSDLAIGTSVTAHAVISTCGKCRACISGRKNLCSNKIRNGYDPGHNGAFAEYIKVQKEQIHILPEGIDMTSLALIEPLANIVHALRNVQIKADDVALIMGPGLIGLLAMLFCKANGATVAISGLAKDQDRLDFANSLGADMILHSEDPNSEKKILGHTGGEGPDIVLDCTGSQEAINQGLRVCRKGGRYIQIGTTDKKLTIDFMNVVYREIEISGSVAHNNPDWEESIRLVKMGKIDLVPFVQKTYSLDEWKEAFKAAETGKEIKVIFKF